MKQRRRKRGGSDDDDDDDEGERVKQRGGRKGKGRGKKKIE